MSLYKDVWTICATLSLILSSLTLPMGCRHSSPTDSSESDVLTPDDLDKRELIRMTLMTALVEKQIPDYNLIKDKENIVLSTENIAARLVPQIPGVNLVLLDRKAIQEKADREGDFLYLRFRPFEIQGDSAVISLDNVWAVGKSSQAEYVSGGGFTIEYRKKSGQWVGTMTKMWIS